MSNGLKAAQLSKANIVGSQSIVDLLAEYTTLKGCTSDQASPAWMLKKWPSVVPIPGSKNKGRIIENLDAANVELTDDEFDALQAALDECTVHGHCGLGGFWLGRRVQHGHRSQGFREERGSYGRGCRNCRGHGLCALWLGSRAVGAFCSEQRNRGCFNFIAGGPVIAGGS